MKQVLSLSLLLFLIVVCARGQQSTAMHELEKIRTFYTRDELQNISGKMLLKDLSTDKAVDKIDFEYWIKGRQFFTKMGYLEILNNDHVYVMVNHKRKTIYARPQASVAQKLNTGLFDPAQLNNLLNSKDATVNLVKDRSNKLSVSNLKNSLFTSVVITYTADYNILALDAVVAAQPGNAQKLALEIRYEPASKNLANMQEVFSELKYLTKNNKGKYIFTNTYQNYQKL